MRGPAVIWQREEGERAELLDHKGGMAREEKVREDEKAEGKGGSVGPPSSRSRRLWSVWFSSMYIISSSSWNSGGGGGGWVFGRNCGV